MKNYIKVLTSGAIAGAAVMQLINTAIVQRLERPFAMGGEYLLPVLIGLVGYIGWKTAIAYYDDIKSRKIYCAGYREGLKIHTCQIVLPAAEDSHYEGK